MIGILVGGGSRRMGGAPKGLLPAPDGSGSVVERLVRIARTALPGEAIVLVGDATAYAAIGIEAIADAPPGIGPIGGLAALMAAAAARGDASAIALACDLPYLEGTLLKRLSQHAPDAAAQIPRVDGVWQPLSARYAVVATRSAVDAALAAGERSLQRVIARLADGIVELPLAPGEELQLRDWDAPADLADPHSR